MKERAVQVDFEAVWDALDHKRRSDHWTWRQLADHLETQDIQISNMKWRGMGIHAHTLAAMMVWLGRDLRDFLR